ncbi:MAG: isoprenylcysteine carboxylmethyltransferase family protein [Microcella sp.]|uniref:methyltransferase family protein n=1 Tax=Microcella sp. TaxID=1913979 RepID=UPI0024C7CB0D|nr:isoprenylcysteine carboxylmethyltransferase family protein [Microcella sp.]UYN82872.1 MAG: isoprenylcysteine carboxylmethyltransferase family protein [Microcella sp.]
MSVADPTAQLHPAAAWALVGAQFLFLLLLGFMPWGDLWSRGIGTVVFGLVFVALGIGIALAAGAGLGRTLTPSPVPKADGELVTTGVYGFVRHPIYSGLLLLGIGLVIIGASVLHLLAWVALLSVLMAKSRFEEWMLAARYPDYAAYAARVGRLVPGIGKLTP